MFYIEIFNTIWHSTQNDSTLKDLIYTYIMIRIFLEELNLYLIFELMSSNREPVHIDWQTNKNYGASETYLSIDYDIFNNPVFKYGNTYV